MSVPTTTHVDEFATDRHTAGWVQQAQIHRSAHLGMVFAAHTRLLDAVQLGLRDRALATATERSSPARLAARGPQSAGAGARIRAVRLVSCVGWGRGLGRLVGLPRDRWHHCRVLLQGHGAGLFVRVQGPVQPEGLKLIVGAEGGAEQRHLARAIDPQDAPFALPALCGGAHHGQLWFVRSADAEQVLGARGLSLKLSGRLPDQGRFTLAQPITLPALPSANLRNGTERADGRPTAGERRLAALIRAWHAGEDGDFLSALAGDLASFELWTSPHPSALREASRETGAVDCLLLNATGHRTVGARHSTVWRDLSRWQVLWVRAMLAERQRQDPSLHRWRACGGDLALRHPQIQRSTDRGQAAP